MCTSVPVVTLETHGSSCFYHSISLNTWNFTEAASSQPVDIAAIAANSPFDVSHDLQYDVTLACMRQLTSRASSLGATYPSAGVVRMAIDRPGNVKCVCVPDEMSMWAGRLFASMRFSISSAFINFIAFILNNLQMTINYS